MHRRFGLTDFFFFFFLQSRLVELGGYDGTRKQKLSFNLTQVSAGIQKSAL